MTEQILQIMNNLSPIGQMTLVMEVLVEIAKRAESAPKPVSGHSVIDKIVLAAKEKLNADRAVVN